MKFGPDTEPQCLKNVGSRVLNFSFLRLCSFLSKIPYFERKTVKSQNLIKNTKICFQHFSGTMVLHILYEFHVSKLIFEGEDLF